MRLVLPLCLLLLGAAPPGAEARAEPRAEALARKVVAAYGGEARLRAIKSATGKQVVTLKLGANQVQMTGTSYFLAPSSHRQEMATGGNTQIIVVTEKLAFMQVGDHVQDMPEREASQARKASDRDLVPGLTALRALDEKRTLTARADTFQGKPVDALEIKGADGEIFKLLLDRASHRLVGSVTPRARLEVLEHHTFEGIPVPSALRVDSGPQSYELRLTELKLNATLAPALFQKPAPRAPAPPKK